MASAELVITNPVTVQFLKALSGLFGWIYTLSWSLSFYPQPHLNILRRSTTGTTPAFPLLNVLGFTCYTISTTTLYSSALIRAQYRARHNGTPNTTRGNDVAFAVHALLISAVTLSQFFWSRLWGFERRKFRSLVGTGVWGLVFGSAVAVGCVIGVVLVKGRDGGRDPEGWAWIDVISAVGYLKLVVTVVKYMPQAWTNYKRKSTVGWSIGQILLDLAGGVLSIAQLVIDSSLQGDWSGILGNPVKFGLGNVSIFFDVVFMVQHYILYRVKGKSKDDEESNDVERSGLLSSDEEDGVPK